MNESWLRAVAPTLLQAPIPIQAPTDYIAKDSSVDMSRFYEGVKNLYTRSDGKIFALPKDHDTIALLYNKAIFDKYGVDYPTDDWTWEDMYEAAKKITEGSNGDVYGLAMAMRTIRYRNL